MQTSLAAIVCTCVCVINTCNRSRCWGNNKRETTKHTLRKKQNQKQKPRLANKITTTNNNNTAVRKANQYNNNNNNNNNNNELGSGFSFLLRLLRRFLLLFCSVSVDPCAHKVGQATPQQHHANLEMVSNECWMLFECPLNTHSHTWVANQAKLRKPWDKGICARRGQSQATKKTSGA